jgi:hypothetical protein
MQASGCICAFGSAQRNSKRLCQTQQLNGLPRKKKAVRTSNKPQLFGAQRVLHKHSTAVQQALAGNNSQWQLAGNKTSPGTPAAVQTACSHRSAANLNHQERPQAA